MFDARFLAYLGVAGLLVLSPGATIAVITETVIEDGRVAGLWTVLGVACANTTLSLAAAFGMSALVRQSPWMLEAVTIAGACYLAYLGVRGVWRAVAAGRSGGAGRRPLSGRVQGVAPGAEVAEGLPGRPAELESGATDRGPLRIDSRPAHPRWTANCGPSFAKGLATNLLNPSVALFYMTVVPQFIDRSDPFLLRFTVLCAAHVVIAAAWHVVYAWSVGTISDRFARPGVKRGMEMATGLVLIALALRLVIGRL
jgi:threonine/homoserine/homoserine lactone efflux protein